MSIKSNILTEISKTFQTIGWDTAEAKGKLTNDSGIREGNDHRVHEG